MTASYSPKHFLLKALSNCQICNLLTAGFFTFDMSSNHPQTYHKTPCPAVLICKRFKKTKEGRIISNFTNAKGKTFLSLMSTKLLLGVISQCGLQYKGLPLPFSLAKKRIYLYTQLKAELTNLFCKLPGYPLPHRQRSRQ